MSKPLGKSFARAAVATLLRDQKAAGRIASVLDPRWIEDDALAEIAEVAVDYVREYRSLPTRFVFENECGKDLVSSKLFRALFKRDITDSAYVLDNLLTFCRQQAVKQAIIESADAAKEGNLDGIVERMQVAVATGTDLSDLGSFYSNVADRIPAYLSGEVVLSTVPTGWSHVDHALGGGLSGGELGVIMAPPNRGKSQALANIAFNATTHLVASDNIDGRAYRVVFYTLEMATRKILKRLDRRAVGCNARQLTAVPDEFVAKLKRQHAMLRAPSGDILIKQFPTRTMSLDDIRSHLDAIETSFSYVPDLIVVDYGDIMRATRRLGETRHEQASCFEDLRTLAGERDVPVWTATQTNRAGVSKRVIRMEDIAESYEKTNVADVIITLCQTPEEEADGRMRLFFAKLRDGQARRTVTASFDFSRTLIRTDGVLDIVSVTKADSKKSEDDLVDKAIKQHKGGRKRGVSKVDRKG